MLGLLACKVESALLLNKAKGDLQGVSFVASFLRRFLRERM